MKQIPVESTIERFFLGASPKTWEGNVVTDDNNDPVMVCSFLGMPTEQDKAEVFEVGIPSKGLPKTITPQTLVRFQQLVARPWSIGDRNGVSFKAAAVVPATKAAQ